MTGPGGADPFASATEAAAALADRTGRDHHDIAVVLGSGWRGAADLLGTSRATVPVSALPGFPEPTVPGHGAELRSVEIDGRPVLVTTGRVHGYEGHDPAAVVHGVRTAVAAGCGIVVLTNAAGAVTERLRIGEPVLLSDHLNLTGASPLSGPALTGMSRFVDLTDAYASRLRRLAREAVPDLREGVYAGVSGPQYETPAEVRMLERLGADLVGMSTVHETIAAVQMGAEVLGLSLVTNLAAGRGVTLDHGEVLEVAARSEDRLGVALSSILRRLVADG